MEIILITLILLIFGLIFLVLSNIKQNLNSTKTIDNFISGLTPDIKPSEIKSPAFKKYRYELLNRLYHFRKNISLNIILLIIILCNIFVIFLIYDNINFRQSENQIIYENNIKLNQKEKIIDSLNSNINLLKNNYQFKLDSIIYENKSINEKLKQKELENKKLNKYIYKLVESRK